MSDCSRVGDSQAFGAATGGRRKLQLQHRSGLLRRRRDADLVRVQDVGLSGGDDPTVLEWAAEQGRVIVSHDVSTLRKHAYERVAAGLRMPGVFEVATTLSVGRVIDDLLLIIECSVEGEWEGQIRYLPL